MKTAVAATPTVCARGPNDREALPLITNRRSPRSIAPAARKWRRRRARIGARPLTRPVARRPRPPRLA